MDKTNAQEVKSCTKCKEKKGKDKKNCEGCNDMVRTVKPYIIMAIVFFFFFMYGLISMIGDVIGLFS
jgi:hypothetical protein